MRVRVWQLGLVAAAAGLAAVSCKTDDTAQVKTEDSAIPASPGDQAVSLQQSAAQYLQAFEQNPAQQMDAPLVKRNWKGQATQSSHPFQRFQNADAFALRDEARIKVMCAGEKKPKACKQQLQASGAQAPIGVNDNPARLVDAGNGMQRSLAAMDQSLKSGKLATSPWSDYYWAIYQGILGFRYKDSNWPSGSWKEKNDYVAANSLKKVVASGNQEAINALSPGEKYDLIVGQANGGGGLGALTANMWSQGKYYWDANGDVEGWMGICHGWAPAAYMMKRPNKTIKVRDYTNKFDVELNPSDLKSLATLLWAESAPRSRFIGGRCNAKNPKRDANGRIEDQVCFDNNPGAWHMAVVNQIGVSKRSFVIDATYDYEVWNQPVYSYEYTYFNPATRKPVATLAEATVGLPFAEDKFAGWRKNPAATKVVGIAMRLSYVVENSPSEAATDSPENDSITSVDYMYDVELDAAGNIIGGEWYSNKHPDFLWTPDAKGVARTWGDSTATGTWTGNGPIPKRWAQGAATDAQSGSPLGKLVYALLDRAQ